MKNKFVLIITCLALLLVNYQCTLHKAEITRIQNGIQLETGTLNVKVQFYASNMVRIVKWLPGTKTDTTSLVIIQKTLPDLKIAVNETDNGIILKSDNLQLLISKKDGHIEYLK
jgi:hypothetical protein